MFFSRRSVFPQIILIDYNVPKRGRRRPTALLSSGSKVCACVCVCVCVCVCLGGWGIWCFFACQYMKIPADLDPNPPLKNSGPEPPPPPPRRIPRSINPCFLTKGKEDTRDMLLGLP